MRISPWCRLLPAVLFVAVWSAAGCQRTGLTDDAKDVKLTWSVRPDPPVVGPAMATVQLTGKDGRPVRGATVKLEGNMTHAGMRPVFADAKETESGHYEATLDLTMGGDWFVLVNVTLPHGRKFTRNINVPGVRSK